MGSVTKSETEVNTNPRWPLVETFRQSRVIIAEFRDKRSDQPITLEDHLVMLALEDPGPAGARFREQIVEPVLEARRAAEQAELERKEAERQAELERKEAERKRKEAEDAEWERLREERRLHASELELEDEPEPLEYWDDDRLFPRFPSTVMLYGASGAHKTNVTLAMLLKLATQPGGPRVLYCAAELPEDVRRHRIPAQCAALGIRPRDLKGRFILRDSVPRLTDDDAVDEFIAQYEDRVDIVVFDTWATATFGVSKLTDEAGALLTGNGPVGRMARELGALMVCVGHQGQDASKGLFGSYTQQCALDWLYHCKADKRRCTITVTVEKAKAGPEGQEFRYVYNRDGVPVPRKMTEEDLSGRRGRGSEADDGSLVECIEQALEIGEEITDAELAGRVKAALKAIQNARRSKAYAHLHAQTVSGPRWRKLSH